MPASERPGDVTVDRSYRTADPRPAAERIELFVERVSEYKADRTHGRAGRPAAGDRRRVPGAGREAAGRTGRLPRNGRRRA